MNKKRIAAAVMALCMVLSMLPVTVQAEEDSGTASQTAETDELNIANNERICENSHGAIYDYGDDKVTVYISDVEKLRNSTFQTKMSVETLLAKINFCTEFAAENTYFDNVLENDSFKEFVRELMGEDYEHRVKEIAEHNDYAVKAAYTKLFVFYVAKQAENWTAEDTVDFVKKENDNSQFSMADPATANNGLTNAAMAYGMYVVYAYDSEEENLIANTESPNAVLDALDDQVFHAWLENPSAKNDAEAYLAALKMIRENMVGQSVREDILKNSFVSETLVDTVKKALEDVIHKCEICGEQFVECEYQSVVTDPTCTEKGFTTYTCFCGNSYVGDYVGETGHSYGEGDGKCKHCGVDAVYVAYYSLSLKGNIGVNYYMHIDKSISDGYMQFTTPRGGTVQIPISQAEQKTVSGKNYYVFTATVAAKEMMDEIAGQYFYGKNSSDVFRYSVKQYADIIFANAETNTEYAKMKPLAEAMLVYGAWAQKLFSYNVENLPVSDYENLNVTAEMLSGFTKAKQGTTNVPLYGATLVLETETTMRLFFDCEADQLTVTRNGEQMEVVQDASGLCYVVITGIAAKDLDTEYTITINDGTETAEITYNPMTFCYNVLNAVAGTYSDELVNTAKALYHYNQAANAYFGES